MCQFLYARLKNGTYYAVAMSVRLSIRPSVRVFRTFHGLINQDKFFKFGTQVAYCKLLDISSVFCKNIIFRILVIIFVHFGSFEVFWAFLAATKQLYKWYFPSVCPSVRHTFLTMFPSSYHHETFRSYYQ